MPLNQLLAQSSQGIEHPQRAGDENARKVRSQKMRRSGAVGWAVENGVDVVEDFFGKVAVGAVCGLQGGSPAGIPVESRLKAQCKKSVRDV